MKKVFIAVIIIMIIIIGIFWVREHNQNKGTDEITNYASNDTNNDTNTNVNNTTYENLIPDLLAIAKENNQDVVAVIQDTETEDITEITEEEVKYYKRINEGQEGYNALEKIIETKIYAIEAKKRNLKLEEKYEQVIKRAVDSEDLVEDVESEEEKEKIKEIADNYLREGFYEVELKDNISDEIDDYNLSIKDEELNKKVKEYQKLKKDSKYAADDEVSKIFNELSEKYNEATDLYLSKIKEKYIVQK